MALRWGCPAQALQVLSGTTRNSIHHTPGPPSLHQVSRSARNSTSTSNKTQRLPARSQRQAVALLILAISLLACHNTGQGPHQADCKRRHRQPLGHADQQTVKGMPAGASLHCARVCLRAGHRKRLSHRRRLSRMVRPPGCADVPPPALLPLSSTPWLHGCCRRPPERLPCAVTYAYRCPPGGSRQ